MAETPAPHPLSRRRVLGSMAAAAVGAPIALGQLTSGATPASAASRAAAAQLLWHPDPSSDGLKAFEGIEADRGGAHPDRKYVIVEGGDHYRFNIWRDDRDTTGGGDRQRTESKGMVQDGSALKMRDGETWSLSYEMFMPTSLHGTSKFTHIFQTKTPVDNGGPYITLDLGRSGSTETLRARAYANSGSPDIASTNLAPLRNKWITIEWTFTIGSKGKAAFVARNGTGSGAPVAVQGSMSNVKMPDQDDYQRPKWGIYRSVESASSDILDTYLLFRNFRASKA
ncbi:hypothetical protein [Streptomyces sp. MK37H]|uniref:hypothetical protein n=1 Tax=Streptomyces sp. MK37H TaxID=2699117 RepID=UPI001B36F592|nr:hypothetical protein [Streptomyces sp. MK37H]MBP8533355.1 hypothetical protein [Streptomyces sp. MK37H]